MTEETTCAHPGCTCTTAREDGFCSDFCATDRASGGDATQECGCGHTSCDHVVAAAE